MRSIDLMTVLAQTSGAANVVPGAAQVLAVRALAGTKNAVVETAVALSDGSRISFVSMDRVLAFA